MPKREGIPSKPENMGSGTSKEDVPKNVEVSPSHEESTLGSESNKKIEEVRERLKSHETSDSDSSVSEESHANQPKSLALPSYLQKHKRNSALGYVFNAFLARSTEVEGRERLPKSGPFLVVANHFGDDAERLMALLKDYDVHIAASNEVHWTTSPLKTLALQQMRALRAPESLQHLSIEQKKELLYRIQDKTVKAKYQRIIEREGLGRNSPVTMSFIRESIALLSRDDVIVVFPEGLWMYEEGREYRPAKMYQGYNGIEVIARQYKKRTNKELPIVPIALYKENKKTHVKIGQPVELEQHPVDTTEIDWVMTRIAEMLPEEQRGYYKNFAETEK